MKSNDAFIKYAETQFTSISERIEPFLELRSLSTEEVEQKDQELAHAVRIALLFMATRRHSYQSTPYEIEATFEKFIDKEVCTNLAFFARGYPLPTHAFIQKYLYAEQNSAEKNSLTRRDAENVICAFLVGYAIGIALSSILGSSFRKQWLFEYIEITEREFKELLGETEKFILGSKPRISTNGSRLQVGPENDPICTVVVRSYYLSSNKKRIESSDPPPSRVSIGGDVDGSIIASGENITINDGHSNTHASISELRREYLNNIFGKVDRLELISIYHTDDVSNNELLNLKGLYVSQSAQKLQTSDTESGSEDNNENIVFSPKKPKVEQRNALELVLEEPRMILLGEAGIGKSSFVNFIILCLAGEGIGHEQTNLRTLSNSFASNKSESNPSKKWVDIREKIKNLLPVLVKLRHLASFHQKHYNANSNLLKEYISAQLEGLRLSEYRLPLFRELKDQGGILLLDGLDEVNGIEEFQRLLSKEVIDFSSQYPKCRVIITSRKLGYERRKWAFSNFAEAELMLFNREQINYTIRRWYELIQTNNRSAKPQYQIKETEIKEFIDNNRYVFNLAQRPLLLTLMLSLNTWGHGSLPKEKADLYDRAVMLLLENWEVRKAKTLGKDGGNAPLSAYMKIGKEEIRKLLSLLAFEAIQDKEQAEGGLYISKDKLIRKLFDLNNNSSVNLADLEQYLSERSGILVPIGEDRYTFSHRTVQEYMAACHLTEKHNFPEEIAKLAREDPPRWREVVLLAAAKASFKLRNSIWLLCNALCVKAPTGMSRITENHWGGQLAAQALLETIPPDEIPETYLPVKKKLQNCLKSIISHSKFELNERILAGLNLAALGDNRRHICEVDRAKFTFVPGGDFWMGAAENNKHSYPTEQPGHLNPDLVMSFYMSVFPVSNGQFTVFEKERGYDCSIYWEEAAKIGIWKEGYLVSNWSDDVRNAHKDYGSQFNAVNQPVVGITWYEALAYCRWLDNRWKKMKMLSSGYQVVLPSERMWEKAARGGVKIPAKKRIKQIGSLEWSEHEIVGNILEQRQYPWGDAITIDFALFAEHKLISTNPLGCFPGGESPYGCQEMSGGINEWCSTKWGHSLDSGFVEQIDESNENRVIRGGGWSNSAYHIRCSHRFNAVPTLYMQNIGFRIAVVPKDMVTEG
ncbi:MAG: SUMF1/EgtB/PvdO family nonheme iron enzyme [Calditrichia bacterium]